MSFPLIFGLYVEESVEAEGGERMEGVVVVVVVVESVEAEGEERMEEGVVGVETEEEREREEVEVEVESAEVENSLFFFLSRIVRTRLQSTKNF